MQGPSDGTAVLPLFDRATTTTLRGDAGQPSLPPRFGLGGRAARPLLACEEDRISVVRPLEPEPAFADTLGADALLQSIELAVAAEELGADGAYFRVHHFARQLASPFPLLAAVGARTSRIEIGTAVIDMRYENPMYFAEDAGAADLIAGGRLQLGISRGRPSR